MGVLSDSHPCSLGGFDLLFNAVKLKNDNVDVHFGKMNSHGQFTISIGGEVCNGDEFNVLRAMVSIWTHDLNMESVTEKNPAKVVDVLPRHGNVCFSLTEA